MLVLVLLLLLRRRHLWHRRSLLSGWPVLPCPTSGRWPGRFVRGRRDIVIARCSAGLDPLLVTVVPSVLSLARQILRHGHRPLCIWAKRSLRGRFGVGWTSGRWCAHTIEVHWGRSLVRRSTILWWALIVSLPLPLEMP